MCYDDFMIIVENMKADYEERVSDYIIKNADLGKERKDLIKAIKSSKLLKTNNRGKRCQPDI